MMSYWILFAFFVYVLFSLHMIRSHDCVDVIAQKENYVPDYKIYHNLSTYAKYLKDLSKTYPQYIKLTNKFISKNGQSQLLTRVSNFSSKTFNESSRIKILFAYGEHAREFFPVESLLYFLTNLTSGTNCLQNSCLKHSNGFSFSHWVLSNFDFYIIAMTNPDGRRFIEKTQNYCWRGTAGGVDLNRNFDWNFGHEGSSSNPDDDEYRGAHAFSEPETKVFQHITKDVSMDAFISFHSGIRHIYIPYADSLSKVTGRVPDNKDHMKLLAERLSRASPLRPFKYGVASQLTGYVADGTSIDYMAGVKKIPFSLAIELWQHRRHRGRSCFDEFNPFSPSLQKELALVHPLYVELLLYLYKWKKSGFNTDKKDGWKEKRLVRMKKDGSQFSNHEDASLDAEGKTAEQGSAIQNELTFLVALVAVVVIVYLVFKQILHFLGKKRVVSLRSLSSTFSLLKSL